MGKQGNKIQIVSQERFDKDLDDSINILIEDGADDKTINTYIDDYKSRFKVGSTPIENSNPIVEDNNVKKKETSVSEPPNTPLASNVEKKGGSLESSTEDDSFNKALELIQNTELKTDKLPEIAGLPKLKRVQNSKGELIGYDEDRQTIHQDPLTGEIEVVDAPYKKIMEKIQSKVFEKSGISKEEIKSLGDNVKVRKLLKEPETFLDLHIQEKNNGKNPLKLAQELSAFKEEFGLRTADEIIEQSGVNIDDVAKDFKEKIHTDSDSMPFFKYDFIDTIGVTKSFGNRNIKRKNDIETTRSIFKNISEYGFNEEDINGFIENSNTRIKKLQSDNILSEVDPVKKENIMYNIVNKYTQDRLAYLKNYKNNLIFRNKRGQDVSEEFKIAQEEEKKLLKGFVDYTKNELPNINSALDKKRKSTLEKYKKFKKGEVTTFDAVKKFTGNVFRGAGNSLSDLVVLVSDKIGADEFAEKTRLSSELDKVIDADRLLYSFETGKKVKEGDLNLMITKQGRIIDLDAKKDITSIAKDLGLNSKTIIEKAKKEKEETFSFSAGNTAYISGDTIGDLLIQALGTKGTTKVVSIAGKGLSTTRVASISGMITSGAMTYSSTYENTLEDLRSKGVSEREATQYANEIALTVSATATVASSVAYNPKALQALDSSPSFRNVIASAINTDKELGKKAMIDLIRKNTIKTIYGTTKEGLEEVVQENLEFLAERLSNKRVNKNLNSKVLEEGISRKEIIQNSISAFATSSALASIGSARENFTSNDNIELMTILSNDTDRLDSNLEEMINSGLVKEEDAISLKKNVNDFKNHFSKIPKDVDRKKIPKLLDLLSERDSLEKQKENTDKAFHGKINESLSSIQKSIDDIVNDVKVGGAEEQSKLSKETSDFVNEFENVTDISDINNGTAQIDIDGAKVAVKSEEGKINLKSISVDDNDRGQEKAKNALKKITEIADEKGLEIELSVTPLDETTNKEQLEKFYSDNGFIKTEGDNMIRKPLELDSFQSIDKIISENDSTSFNPLESEGESISRLSKQIEEGKSKEQVAKEHTDSYLDYLNEQEVSSDVINSDFVKNFESKLLKALNNPNKFNENKDRNFNNGSRLDKQGNVISEEQYLRQKGNLPSNKKELPSFEEISSIGTGINNYDISVENGDLVIKPEFGNISDVSNSELRRVKKEYSESFDFSKGEKTNFSNSKNITDNQVSEKIASESNNPLEIFNELQKVIDRSDSVVNFETKEDYIADALSNFALTNDSKSQVTDLGSFYTNIGFRRNKNKKSIDQIREIAESNSDSKVEIQDVLDFLNKYPKLSDFRDSKDTSSLIQSDLKDRFKQMTGLDINNSISDIINKKFNNDPNNDSNIDDVPFQTESNQTSISGGELSSLVDRLKKTGLSEDVIILNDKEIEKKLNEIKEENIIETPFGFVEKGKVYLNRDKVKKDTPIHEFGHLWNSFIKENNPDVYNKGLELIKGTEYHNQVVNNPAYDNLSKEGKLEEALAQSIGEKGVKILNESKKKSFNSWFVNLFRKIARGLGLRNISAKELSNISLDKFTDLASAEILSGKDINTKNDLTQNNSNSNSIDSIIESEIAKQKERKKIIDEIKSKKSISEDIRKKIVAYINDKINKKNVSEVNKREIKTLLNTVRTTKTKRNLLNAFKKVDDIFLGVDNKVLLNNINKILNKKLSKKESGRRKANLVTEEVELILNKIKKSLSQSQQNVSPLKSKNKINSIISQLLDERTEIQSRSPLFQLKVDPLNIEALSIAIDILTAQTSSNKATANQKLIDSLSSIESIFSEGISQLKELSKQTSDSLNNSIKEYINDADLSGERTTKSNQELDKDNKSLKNLLKRSLFTIGSGKLTGNLDSIMTILSKKGGDTRDSSPLVRFASKIKNRETLKKRRVSIFSNIVTDSQKSIFGSIRKADIILNKKQTLKVNRKPFGSDPNTPKIQETLELTNSELLNLWMNNKNEKLRGGLENNGFDEKFFNDLQLPKDVLLYGESLFDIYEDLHLETDNVFRKMNFHSMGKEDFYAGKVHRTDVDATQNDLKLDSGNFSVNTTGFGSQKERTNNDKPIQAVDVNRLVQRAISETSHYVAYAEVHREYSKLIKDKEFNQVVRLNNGVNGDLIIDMLRFYKERDLEKGGYQGNKILDLFGRNITRATLALKAKVGITQTISFLNGAIDMPPKTEKPFISYYNPIELVKTMRFLLKESDYLKNRYDIEGIENAVTGLSDIASKSSFSLENNTLEANRKAFSRFMNQAINISLSNVKYGDMFGLSGAVPSYLAWRDKFEKQGLSKEKAHEKALRKFEASADRSQQTTSSFGKSPFQRDPVGRYLAMFATSPIQNMQNANYHWRELIRGLSKGKESKGSNFKNIMGVFNYQFAQPMLYTYIANLMAGSLLPVLGVGEEEPDDIDKSLANSALLSNYGSIPVIGGIMQLFLDKATGKDFSFGSLINSPMISFIDNINEDLEKWMNAGNKQAQVKYRTRTLKKLSALLLSVPNILTDTALDFEEIYWNDDVDETVKVLKALGWSNFTIEKARTKRLSRIKSKREKVKEKRKWNKSLRKYEKQKKIIRTKKAFKKNGDNR